MQIKKFRFTRLAGALILVGVALVSSIGDLAADDAAAYIEGRAGWMETEVSSANTTTLAPGASGNRLPVGQAHDIRDISIRAEDSVIVGVEIGYRNIQGTGFGVGFSYDRGNTNHMVTFDDLSWREACSPASVAANIAYRINCLTEVNRGATSSAPNVATDLEVKFTLVGLNFFHEWGNRFRPYVGVFLGIADTEFSRFAESSREMAYGATVGARFAVDEAAYVGVKADYRRIDITDPVIKEVDGYAVSTTFGVVF